MENKTHYRRAFKSDHLGSADLAQFIEDKKSLVFKIKEVKLFEVKEGVKGSGAKVAGKFITANIAYFHENIKPMVLNAGNSSTVRGFANGSEWLEDWKDIYVELYIKKHIKFGNERVEGAWILPIQPVIKKVLPKFTESNFEKAKEAGASLDKIKSIYSVTPEISAKYSEYVK